MGTRLNTLINEYIKGANKFFPELDFSSSFSMYAGNEPTSTKFEFGNHDAAIKNSLYRINSEQTFIHFTTIDSLFNILNTAQLRLYNLYNLNDPKEFRYALSNAGIKQNEINLEYYKRNMFLTSFCSYNMKEQDEDYNMWRLYGGDGNGVGLVFGIEDYQNHWNEVYFGKVHYGNSNEAFNNLKAFIDYHHSFNNDHKILDTYPTWIPVMCMLHKDKIWEIEKECRLFAFCPFDEYTFESNPGIKNYLMYDHINHCINKKGEKVAYTHIPLNLPKIKEEFQKKLKNIEGGAESLFSSFPHFKLKRIVLGYNLNKAAFNTMDYAYKIAKEKLGYSVEIFDSVFKKILQ
ncbi:MAG: DUF2971 domain-containing protein [Bacteroidota bacterium]